MPLRPLRPRGSYAAGVIQRRSMLSEIPRTAVASRRANAGGPPERVGGDVGERPALVGHLPTLAQGGLHRQPADDQVHDALRGVAEAAEPLDPGAGLGRASAHPRADVPRASGGGLIVDACRIASHSVRIAVVGPGPALRDAKGRGRVTPPIRYTVASPHAASDRQGLIGIHHPTGGPDSTERIVSSGAAGRAAGDRPYRRLPAGRLRPRARSGEPDRWTQQCPDRVDSTSGRGPDPWNDGPTVVHDTTVCQRQADLCSSSYGTPTQEEKL
jgi:hypothetical protein